jgi:hypothetical protein
MDGTRSVLTQVVVEKQLLAKVRNVTVRIIHA